MSGINCDTYPVSTTGSGSTFQIFQSTPIADANSGAFYNWFDIPVTAGVYSICIFPAEITSSLENIEGVIYQQATAFNEPTFRQQTFGTDLLTLQANYIYPTEIDTTISYSIIIYTSSQSVLYLPVFQIGILRLGDYIP